MTGRYRLVGRDRTSAEMRNGQTDRQRQRERWGEGGRDRQTEEKRGRETQGEKDGGGRARERIAI